MRKLPIVDENNNVIKAPSEWKEITLGKWQEFSTLLSQLQAGATMLEEGEELTKMSYEDIVAKYPSYIIKIVSFWTGLTDAELMQLEYDQITYCYGLIFDSLTPPEPIEEYDKGFKFKGTFYEARKTETDIEGNMVFSKNASFMEGIEYLQLSLLGRSVGSGEFENISKQIAIMYRPEGEEYDEDIASERAELFKDLTMDIVWQVAFFFARLSNSYTRLTLKSLTQKVQEARQTLASGDITTFYTQQAGANISIWQKLKNRIFTR